MWKKYPYVYLNNEKKKEKSKTVISKIGKPAVEL